MEILDQMEDSSYRKYYAEYLNHLRSDDFQNAFNSLQRYYDLLCSSCPGLSFYYPLLNLIPFYFHFGKYEEAIKIIDQALPLARADEDGLLFLKRWTKKLSNYIASNINQPFENPAKIMAVIQKSIFDNVDLSLPLMVLSKSWKTFGNDHLSALFSALAIEYSKEISKSHLPKSLDSKDALTLSETIAMQAELSGNISFSHNNPALSLLLNCKKAIRENDFLAVDRLPPNALKDISNQVKTVMKSECHKLVDAPDKAMQELFCFLSDCKFNIQLEDMLNIMIQQADIYLDTGTSEGPFAALTLVLLCLSLSEKHCYKKINDIASLKLVEIFIHLSLGTQAASVLDSILPKVLNSSDLHVKSYSYYLWAQTKILQDNCDSATLDMLHRAEAGFQLLSNKDYICRTVYLQSAIHLHMGDTKAYNTCLLKLNL